MTPLQSSHIGPSSSKILYFFLLARASVPCYVVFLLYFLPLCLPLQLVIALDVMGWSSGLGVIYLGLIPDTVKELCTALVILWI